MENGQLKREKTFFIGNFEVVWPLHDATITAVKRTSLSGSVQHVAITDTVGTTGEYQYVHRDHLGSVEKI
ncbi:hypothetical protein MO867_21395, partial [Microbulbifer sp. OS29]